MRSLSARVFTFLLVAGSSLGGAGGLMLMASGTAYASAACPTEPSNGVCIPAQGGMEGNLQVTPGTTIYAGYNFSNGGGASTVTVQAVSLQLDLKCSSGTASPSVLVVSFPATQTFTSPFPTAQSDPKTYEASAVVPNACGGATVGVGVPNAGPFSAQFWSDKSGVSFNVQFHYGIASTVPAGADGCSNCTGNGTSWSGARAATALPLPAPQLPQFPVTVFGGIAAAVILGGAAVFTRRKQKTAASRSYDEAPIASPR